MKVRPTVVSMARMAARRLLHRHLRCGMASHMQSPAAATWLGCIMLAVAGLLGSGSASAFAGDVPTPVLQAQQQRIAAIAKATRSTVMVFANGGRGGGSAVVISRDGFALTNFHVVKPVGFYMQCGMADGRLYDAVLVGIDPTGDMAMIKLVGRDDFTPAELGDSDTVRPGDWCFAIGNPFLLATNFQPSVSYGIISGTHRYQPPAGTLLEYTDCLQTDAAINPGNSGGPLFDAQGRLIGINGRCSFEKRGRVNVGVGYAISINQIKKFLGYLHSGRIVDHATLGATVATDDQGHVVVSNILESSDAYRRGLRFGDQIVMFGGREITTVNGFKNILGTFPRAWRVPLSYIHEGQRTDIYVRLEGVHTHDELIQAVQGKPKKQPAKQIPGRGKKAELKQPRGKPSKPPLKKAPRSPQPAPKLRRMQPPAPPAAVAKLIEKRRGYANYYFNRQNQDRVWHHFERAGLFAKTPAHWTLTGKLDGGGPFRIELGPTTALLQLPGRRDRIDLSRDLDQQLVPAGTGGLLPALYVWQQLLRLGPAKFGEVYYLGTAPLIDHQGLYDVLVGTHNVVELWSYFDPKSGLLTAVEMYPAAHVDPCEIYFDDYKKTADCLWPHRITVRYGDGVVLRMNIEKIALGAARSQPEPDSGTDRPVHDNTTATEKH